MWCAGCVSPLNSPVRQRLIHPGWERCTPLSLNGGRYEPFLQEWGKCTGRFPIWRVALSRFLGYVSCIKIRTAISVILYRYRDTPFTRWDVYQQVILYPQDFPAGEPHFRSPPHWRRSRAGALPPPWWRTRSRPSPAWPASPCGPPHWCWAASWRTCKQEFGNKVRAGGVTLDQSVTQPSHQDGVCGAINYRISAFLSFSSDEDKAEPIWRVSTFCIYVSSAVNWRAVSDTDDVNSVSQRHNIQ